MPKSLKHPALNELTYDSPLFITCGKHEIISWLSQRWGLWSFHQRGMRGCISWLCPLAMIKLHFSLKMMEPGNGVHSVSSGCHYIIHSLIIFIILSRSQSRISWCAEVQAYTSIRQSTFRGEITNENQVNIINVSFIMHEMYLLPYWYSMEY